MELIDKSALVAEIKRQILAIDNTPKITDTQISVLSGNKVILTKLLSFIDALEVKEVKEPADAFIEKASEWLKDNVSNYATVHLYSTEVNIEEDKMIEDFKKYMER